MKIFQIAFAGVLAISVCQALTATSSNVVQQTTKVQAQTAAVQTKTMDTDARLFNYAPVAMGLGDICISDINCPQPQRCIVHKCW